MQLLKCDPNYNIWFGDGERVLLSSDLATMKEQVERWEGKDGYERYLAFLQESHKHYELSVTHVLLRNFETLAAMLRWSFLQHLLALHPFESIWTRASKYFWTERLRRVFTFGSMYMGMSPFDAPGTYSLLQYTELAEGIWYPVGGFHRVVEALVEVGKRLGVEYRLGTGVEAILLENDGAKAKGVRLESGEVLEADIVVNNSDLVYAYNELLPKTSYADSLSQRPGSCSSISFYWALSEKVPKLEPHNIFLADEYRESFDSIFKKQLIPDEPSFYVNVPSRIDPTAAPPNGDSVVVLVPVGHLVESNEDGTSKLQSTNGPSTTSPTQPGITPTPTQDWPAMIALARKTILATIKARTGADLAPLIQHELTNDPMSWRDRFNLDKGAILGLSHSFFNVLSFRPSTRARRPHWIDGKLGSGVVERVVSVILDTARGRAKDVRGLYMVGASAHPGTGVPIVLAGGKMVAEQVLEDQGMVVPWGGEGKGMKREGSLDRVDRPFWLDDSRSWLFVVVAGMALPWVLGMVFLFNSL